jgi:hypothetical protein
MQHSDGAEMAVAGVNMAAAVMLLAGLIFAVSAAGKGGTNSSQACSSPPRQHPCESDLGG